jgi:hypothetical protein
MTYNAFAARNRLVEKGLTAEQAEAVLEVIQEHDEATGKGLATKADLGELKIDLIKVVFGTALAQFVGTVGLIITLVKALH